MGRRKLIFWGLLHLLAAGVCGDITNWQTGETIAGTETITPGPDSILGSWSDSDHNLQFADLSHLDLTGSSFAESWLQNAKFTNSNLSQVSFFRSKLAGADFSGSNIKGAFFALASGFTKEQLYSTASYQNKNLERVSFGWMHLEEWDFSGQNLTGASFLSSRLTGTNFTDAVINNAHFSQSMLYDQLSKDQLYATASYKTRDLSGLSFGIMSLYRWDLSNQNLTNARFEHTYLGETDFTDAVIKGSRFLGTSLSQQQIRSTASYKNKDLQGVRFSASLSGFDFSCQNLTDASFVNSNVSGANFREANLTRADFTNVLVGGADFTDAIITGANFKNDSSDLMEHQLYSTASYKNKNLQGVTFGGRVLMNWDLSGQNLIETRYSAFFLYASDFSLSDLRRSSGWKPDSMTITRNTIRPDGQIQGLSMTAGDVLTIRNLDLEITISDQMLVAQNSTLQFILDENPWGSTINVASGIVPEIDGTIELLFAQGSDTAKLIGTTYKLFNWNGQLAQGQEFAEILSQPDLCWDTSRLYSTGEVTLVPEPAAIGLLATGALLLRQKRKLQ